jgi:predicted nucleic acid-binding protein
LNPEEARLAVRDLMSRKPIPADPGVLEGAWIVQDRWGYSWWDALTVSSAKRAGCRYLITENLRHGQEIDEVTIINPFLESPKIFGHS